MVLSTFTPIVDSVAAYKGIEPSNMRSLLERFIDDSDNQFAKTIQTLLQTNQDSTETRSAIVELLDEYDAETVTEHMMNSLEI